MILDDLVKAAEEALKGDKAAISPEQMEALAETSPYKPDFPFEKALSKDGISFICEVKRASPSKGMISPSFPYLDIAREYERIGASAISCLTERKYFLGKPEYLRDIASIVSIPVLRKDFIIDEYQIYEARALGASAVLLICAIITDEKMKHFMTLADSLGLSVLTEVHDEEEVRRALAAGARIIGANNRNLKDFTVSLSNAVRLSSLVPEDILFVAESGIRTRKDIETLERCGADAVLIGETFMRAPDKEKMFDTLRGGTR